MEKNKKAEGEILFLLLICLVIGGFMFAIGDNEYKSFMRDCEGNNNNIKKFEVNETYVNMFNQTRNKIDKISLENYCQDRFAGTKQSNVSTFIK